MVKVEIHIEIYLYNELLLKHYILWFVRLSCTHITHTYVIDLCNVSWITITNSSWYCNFIFQETKHWYCQFKNILNCIEKYPHRCILISRWNIIFNDLLSQIIYQKFLEKHNFSCWASACWYLWSRLLPEAMLMSLKNTATWNHVDVCDLL